MPRRRIRLTASAEALSSTFRDIRAEIGIPETFPPEVLAEAERRSRSPRLPDVDRTEIPSRHARSPESMDLDQAFHLTRRPAAGSGSDTRSPTSRRSSRRAAPSTPEAHRRAETAYSPDVRTPLYPPAISEACGLAVARWSAAGRRVAGRRRRGRARGRRPRRAGAGLEPGEARLRGNAAALDAGHRRRRCCELLPEIGVDPAGGRARPRRGEPRRAHQEVVPSDGGYALAFTYAACRSKAGTRSSPCSRAGRGRASCWTVASASSGRCRRPIRDDVARLRRVAAGLGVDWPDDMTYAGALAYDRPRPFDAPRRSSCRRPRSCSAPPRTPRSTGEPPPDPDARRDRCPVRPLHGPAAAAGRPLRERGLPRSRRRERRCRRGRARRCPALPDRDGARRADRGTASSGRSSTPWRRPCSRHSSARNPTRS